MDVREKLVEFQSIITCPNAICNFCEHFKNKGACEKHKKEVIADNMIANGVTVQEWIPVEDRLPEPFVSVLACIPSEEPLPAVHESYIADHGAWVCILTAERYKTGEVTHWMPMPQPPKGE